MNISDSESLLTSAQVSLLQSCAAKHFNLGGFSSLDNIVTKLKVDVHIEPGIPVRQVNDYYDKAIEYWKKVYKQLEELAREDKSLRDKCQKAEIKLGRLYSERQAHSSMTYLGFYDSQKNIIKLKIGMEYGPKELVKTLIAQDLSNTNEKSLVTD